MSFNDHKQKVCILGSTGSIGVNTLNVIETNSELYEVFALTAKSQVDKLFKQCVKFQPAFAVMLDSAAAVQLKNKLLDAGSTTEVLQGMEGLTFVAGHEQSDCVMAAIVGGAGLLPTLRAAEAGKKVLLANKEALVMAGRLFMQLAEQSGAQIIPIDSEHNAIFQCLPIDEQAKFANQNRQGVEKIILTASGGPFLNSSLTDLQQVTPEQACKHPNWSMGPKISVDSATMLNKALELIEASFLFDLPVEHIEILIHPQSVIHSMVYYRDGSVLAQLGNPDMRTPIAYGLSWPNRIAAGVKTLNLCEVGQLNFQAADADRFPCLALGRAAALAQGSAPIILNAANEVAVAAFLKGEIGFTQIPVIIEESLNVLEYKALDSIEEVLEEDNKARSLAQKLIFG
ncbi:MAG: 1-deoxy-D-xylulose-5-phosphate reductoisomerase [SAR86 cluster bacterium]|uniref:1-deoxy-D-xylulose 5-phosphate reductoisomerase n=1 Tax=SAR86 cluster bacterium TaxID=2030880 RepID=A0A2A5CAB9_9GAMM|nr:MAG: 1-deoxy-D-xylulose-5-phosphate reductoisomerase [SAR86 cluster bacterium]